MSPSCLSPAAISLVVLVLQNSILVVMTRYSRISVPPEDRYYASTLVLNQEIVKMALCIVIFAFERCCPNACGLFVSGSAFTYNPGFFCSLRRAVFQKEALIISVPAAMFTLQNYLIFLGLSNLDAMSFQVWSQTKLLSAAVFSVILLGRSLHTIQWVSLFFFSLGVFFTQIPAADQRKTVSSSAQRPLLGVFSCVLSSLLSSYAGVYFEKVVKATPPSLAVRNIHLSIFGIPFAAISLFLVDVFPTLRASNAQGPKFSFWRGYNHWLTICLVFIHALGGLLVAVVMKYADNILKGLATGIAVIVSGILSFIIWGETPSLAFVIGCCVITISTLIYHKFDKTSPCKVSFKSLNSSGS